MGLERRVRLRLRASGLGPAPRLVVGFSGGPDSLVLAAVLARLRGRGVGEVVAVHVDHGLRPESGAEAVQATELAAELGLRCLVRQLPDDPRARHPGLGTEEAVRRERYRVLAAEAEAVGAAAVALAHHRDDQAETVLLHLLRGAGLTGARGMAELARVEVPWWDEPAEGPVRRVTLWRPLLDEPRAVLAECAADLGLTPVHDPSNDDPTFRRNALRLDVLPAIERHVPGAGAALARFAGLSAADDDALEAIAAEHGTAATVGDRLLLGPLAGQPLAVRRRVVRRWLEGMGRASVPTAERVDAVLGLVDAAGGKRVEIGEGVSVERARGELRLVGPAAPGGRRGA